jgi:hypothetical protein
VTTYFKKMIGSIFLKSSPHYPLQRFFHFRSVSGVDSYWSIKSPSSGDNSSGDISTSGGENRFSGGENSTRGGENRFSGGENSTRGGENRFSGGENRFSGGENRFSGGENSISSG